jgi:pimeloyl-ACP methyl ester carboxylesterase
MNLILVALSWLFGLLLLVLAVMTAFTGKFLPMLPLLLAALLLLPPVRSWMHTWAGITLPFWLRIPVVVALLYAYIMLSFIGMATEAGVYSNAEVKARHLSIYDEKVAQWPGDYEDVYVDTSYGKVHVIVSGPEDAPPMLLLNAAAMSGWSWLYNVVVLNQSYRTYAVDTIGEVGKSELDDLERYPTSGKEYADLHVEITDALGFQKSQVVGASMGGYLGTSYALHYPERVEKLALLGPMGMTPETAKTALRIMFVQFFPLKPIQKNTVSWALGTDSYVLTETDDWFRIVLTDTVPKEGRPVTFTPQELQSLEVPVLLVIGTRDSLTGAPEGVKKLANNTPDIQIEVLDSGHLIGVEHAETCNALMREFFAEN